MEISYVDGKQHGVCLQYYNSGKLCAKSHWKQGKSHGDWTAWYEDGTKASEEHHVLGQIHGTRTFWGKDGSVVVVEEWDHGKRLKQVLTEQGVGD